MFRFLNLLDLNMPEAAIAVLQALLEAAISSGNPEVIDYIFSIVGTWQ